MERLASGADGASKRPLVYLQQPVIRINGLWNGCRSEGLAGQATRGAWLRKPARLIGPLAVGMGEKRLRELNTLPEGAWPVHQ